MLVRERMSKNPYTVQADTPVEEALKRMREFHVRRFPVLDKAGQLVGIVSEKDLLYASPAPTRHCLYLACAPEVNWSNCAQPTCALHRKKRPFSSTR